MPDQAEIHRMTKDKDSSVRLRAARALGTAFTYVPHKSLAWKDLHRLTQDQDSKVRWEAANAIGTAFDHIPNKSLAWQDLHRLAGDEDSGVRWRAADSLGAAFSHVLDKALAWQDLHRLTGDEDSGVRLGAAKAIGTAFAYVPNKSLAWQDLIRLIQDENSSVQRGATIAIGTAFAYVPNKSLAWQDLIRLTPDEYGFSGLQAARALGTAFAFVPNKSLAWQDLHRRTQDEKSNVRLQATIALGTAFDHIPNKSLAWQDLIRLTQDEYDSVGWKAAEALGTAFVHVPDKSLAWQDLHTLTQDEFDYVREGAARALGTALVYVSKKSLVWKDLHRLTQDEKSNVREEAAYVLGEAFVHIPDKSLAWQDLHRLTQDEYGFVGLNAAKALVMAFVHVPDKSLAWQDLIRLTQDDDLNVREVAFEALGTAFVHVPDKSLAWQDLIRLTQDDDLNVREVAFEALGTAFVHVPDKSLAWQDLIRLTQDEKSNVREEAAYVLGEAFVHIPDKSLAWQDLHRLTQDVYGFSGLEAAEVLGTAFDHIPDKSLAWKDLHRLTQDQDSKVRLGATIAIGTAFVHIPDESLAWKDLHRLTQDKDSSVRMHAYHSLGRATISKATEAKDNDTLKNELMAAIAYFEKSSQMSEYSPARFCSPFYRTYYIITFQDSKEKEVQRYLAEAKEAVGGSESNDELLLAVENLAQALRESQRLKSRSLEELTSELNTYRWYCDEAASHMATAEKDAPGAVKLMRKCNPMLEERIQATIADIQKKARKICEITRGSGTVYEAPGAELQKAARALSAADLSSIQENSTIIVWQLKKFCRLLPLEDREQVCAIVEKIEHEPVFPEKLNKIKDALLCLSPVLADKSPPLADAVILTVLPEEYGSIQDRLTELGPPPNTVDVPNLYAWKFGKVSCRNLKADYKIAVGMIGRAGTTEGALAAREAVQLWRPRYVLFCGIAGGLPDHKERNSRPRLGDVVVADIIYGYEYGKLEKEFKPRANWTYRADQALLNGATAYALSDGWRDLIRAEPPRECTPQVVRGEIASGDQVVDDPSNDFFAQVLKAWPKINAVEMEGAGAAAAIEQAGSQGIPTRFMMIRGISDLSRAKGKNKGRKERDAWKSYASDAAAAFVMGWIAEGLPLPPSDKRAGL